MSVTVILIIDYRHFLQCCQATAIKFGIGSRPVSLVPFLGCPPWIDRPAVQQLLLANVTAGQEIKSEAEKVSMTFTDYVVFTDARTSKPRLDLGHLCDLTS